MAQTKYTFEGYADAKRKAAESAAKTTTPDPAPAASHNVAWGNADFWFAYANGVKLTMIHRKNNDPAIANPPKEILAFLPWAEVDKLEAAVESSMKLNAAPIALELPTVAAIINDGSIAYYNRSASAFFGDGDFLTRFSDGLFHIAWLRDQPKDPADFTRVINPATLGPKAVNQNA